MKEYFGFLELELPKSREYYKGTIALNNARNALIYLMKARKIDSIYIPYYMCQSLVDKVKLHNFDIKFYYLDKDFLPIIENFDQKSLVLYANYFGLFEKQTYYLAEKYGSLLVLDNTQSFYSQPIKDIDIIYSPRKFFGVADGSYLITNHRLNIELGTDISWEKSIHLLKRIEIGANPSYVDYLSTEDSFNHDDIKYMSLLTKRILESIDYESVAKCRRANFKFMHEKLSTINELKFNLDNQVPMVYPLLLKSDDLRKKLIENKIYVPSWWNWIVPFVKPDSIEAYMAKYLIPLPIDQRYNLKDMDYITKFIMERI